MTDNNIYQKQNVKKKKIQFSEVYFWKISIFVAFTIAVLITIIHSRKILKLKLLCYASYKLLWNLFIFHKLFRDKIINKLKKKKNLLEAWKGSHLVHHVPASLKAWKRKWPIRMAVWPLIWGSECEPYNTTSHTLCSSEKLSSN